MERAQRCVTYFSSGRVAQVRPANHYKGSNNGAEYEALIHGLHIALSLGIKRLLAFGNSKVVIEQVNKEWYCIKDTMNTYCTEIRKLESHFEAIEF
jgi:ribonuclease HI